MGFLTGLFQSLMLTRMINTKQHRLTQVMTRIRRVQKESSTLEKSISNQLRGAQQQARQNYAYNISQFQFVDSSGNPKTCDYTSQADLLEMTSQKSTWTTQCQTLMQQEIAAAEEQAEIDKEIYLEQLKDEESDLEIEKEQLEAQIKFYQQWKEGCQQDYQASIKNFKPLGSGSSYA